MPSNSGPAAPPSPGAGRILSKPTRESQLLAEAQETQFRARFVPLQEVLATLSRALPIAPRSAAACTTPLKPFPPCFHAIAPSQGAMATPSGGFHIAAPISA